MKSQSQILNYLQWSRERGLLWPVFASRSTPSCIGNGEDSCTCVTGATPIHRISLLTLLPNETDALMTAESSQLLDKMCIATKIPQRDFYRASLKCCANAGIDLVKSRFHALLAQNPAFILILGEETATALAPLGISLKIGTPQDHNGTFLLLTHHPQELLADPRKKIPAWQHLQTMMNLSKN